VGFENIDDITICYEEDGKELVRELDKEILTRGSWTTILFRYQDLDKSTDKFKEAKATIRRYQKTGGEFRQRSKFNISNAQQAAQISEILTKWFSKDSEK